MDGKSALKLKVGNRKRSHFRRLIVNHNDVVHVLINGQSLERLCISSVIYPELRQILNYTTPGTYDLKVSGGGLSSHLQMVEKVLFKMLDKKHRDVLKVKYPLIDRTDSRRKNPKKFGGPGARARFQKSYR